MLFFRKSEVGRRLDLLAGFLLIYPHSAPCGPEHPAGVFSFYPSSLYLTHTMDIAQDQPVLPLGFGAQRTGDSSGREIKVTVPIYVTALNSLYVTLASHYLSLSSLTYPISGKQSRERLVSPFSAVDWSELSAYLTQVFEHQKHKLRGQPTDVDWQVELELLHQAHIRVYRGY